MARKRKQSRRRGGLSTRLDRKRFPPEAPCACHSGERYRRCCMPLHEGEPADTPSALMRSRYAAYALGRVEYVIDTTTDDSPHRRPDRDAWQRDLEHFSNHTDFDDLEIVDAGDGPGDDEAWVTFRAELNQPDGDASFTERSRFVRGDDGRWRYHAALQTEVS